MDTVYIALIVILILALIRERKKSNKIKNVFAKYLNQVDKITAKKFKEEL